MFIYHVMNCDCRQYRSHREERHNLCRLLCSAATAKFAQPSAYIAMSFPSRYCIECASGATIRRPSTSDCRFKNALSIHCLCRQLHFAIALRASGAKSAPEESPSKEVKQMPFFSVELTIEKNLL